MEEGGRVWKGNTLRHLHQWFCIPVCDCASLHSPFQHPACCLYLSHCRTDRKIHDKNGEITALQDHIAELEEVVQQERREVVNLREGLRLRQESLEVQQRQQQRQQVRREGIGGGM